MCSVISLCGLFQIQGAPSGSEAIGFCSLPCPGAAYPPDQAGGLWAAPGKNATDPYCSHPDFSSYSWISASQFLICFWSISRALFKNYFLQFYNCFLEREFADLTPPNCYSHTFRLRFFNLNFSLFPLSCFFLFCLLALVSMFYIARLFCTLAFKTPVTKLCPQNISSESLAEGPAIWKSN